MQLTKFTDLSLRVLMYLTYRDREARVKIIEIAEQFSVPRNHLIKVVNNLAKLGWVDATRGRNGGLVLSVNPKQLRLGQVLKKIENCNELIDCEKTSCGLSGACVLKNVLDEALNHFYQKMDEYTLADVVTSPTKEKIAQMHLIELSRL